MAEMSRVGKWLVNRGNASRSARIVDRVAPVLRLPPSPRVLEMGAGAGGLSGLVQERFHPGRLVTTDFDPAQLEVARRSLAERFGVIPATIELRQADALHLPFEAASFDCVFAIAMFHHVEERHRDFVRRPEAVREVRRVLAPGGSLVYTEMFRRPEFRACLRENGFTPLLERIGWGHDLAVFRAPA